MEALEPPDAEGHVLVKLRPPEPLDLALLASQRRRRQVLDLAMQFLSTCLIALPVVQGDLLLLFGDASPISASAASQASFRASRTSRRSR